MKAIYPVLAVLLLSACQNKTEQPVVAVQQEEPGIYLPCLNINGDVSHPVAQAFRIAIGDLMSNVHYLQSNSPEDQQQVLFAGLVYGEPWTRDAAINTWNGFGLLSPKIAKNTLLSQVSRDSSGNAEIEGQYWDKIIWTIGAWQYYLYSGDRQFLKEACQISSNSIQRLEREEFSEDLQLFRGPAVYGDGVAAYPDRYTQADAPAKIDSFFDLASNPDKVVPADRQDKSGSFSGIFEWAALNPASRDPEGFGMPMHALSTNAIYFEAYITLAKMEEELKLSPKSDYAAKAEQLKQAINRAFWNPQRNTYRYLVDPFGGCEYQESLGLSFCLLFGIADSTRTQSIFNSVYVSSEGIPCVYPSFPRYRNVKEQSYGRHSGTIWPHIQGFWADAAIKKGRVKAFEHEFTALTQHAVRDCQFAEIYHPETGLTYGGLQEPHLRERTIWFVSHRQSWSASAYLRMILMDLAGMNFKTEGIQFTPYLPADIHELELKGLHYREAVLFVKLSGQGNYITDFKLNGQPQDTHEIPASLHGINTIEISLKESE